MVRKNIIKGISVAIILLVNLATYAQIDKLTTPDQSEQDYKSYLELKSTLQNQKAFLNENNSTKADSNAIDVNWVQFGRGTDTPGSIEYALEAPYELYASKWTAIFKSTDNGETFEPFFNFPDVAATAFDIKDLTFSEIDPNILYFTVSYSNYDNTYNGLYEMDITTKDYKQLFSNSKIYDFCFLSKTNSDTIVISERNSSQENTVWVSIDHGEYWKKIYENDEKNSLEYIQSNNKKYLLAAGDSGIHYIDFDQAWTTQTWEWNNDFKTVERDDTVNFTRTLGLLEPIPGSNEFIASVRFFAHDKYDDGTYKHERLWKVDFENLFAEDFTDSIPWVNTPSNYGDFRFDDMVFSVEFDPNNPDRYWLGEGNDIAYTEDAGVSWEVSTYEYQDLWIAYDIDVNPQDYNNLFVIGDNKSKATTDNFKTISNFGTPTLFIKGLDYYKNSNGNDMVYYGDWTNKIMCEDIVTNELKDGQMEFDIPVMNCLLADPNTEGKVYVGQGSDISGLIYVSNDYGQTIDLVFNSNYMGNITKFIANPSQADEIWFITIPNYSNPYGSCYRSIDGGITGTWEKIEIGDGAYNRIFDLEIDPNDKNTIYASVYYSLTLGSVPEVLKSTDGGNTWTIFNEDNGNGIPAYNNFLWDMTINPFNTQEIYATTFSWPLESLDGGETWDSVAISIDGYENLEYGFDFYQIEYTEFENVLVGTGFNNDFLISRDNGRNWESLRDGKTLSDGIFLDEFTTTSTIQDDSTGLKIYVGTGGMSIFELFIPESDLIIDISNDTTNTDTTTTDIGVLNPFNNQGSSVYPNPTSGTINVKNALDADIRIYNMNGRLIGTFKSQEDVFTTDILETCSPGVYHVLISKDGMTRGEKVLLLNK